MQIKEFNYQKKYIKKLLDSSLEFLEESDNSTIVFQAPTWSGKTVMMAQFLQQLATTFNKQDLSFVRISVNSLHEQSKESLENIFNEQKILECINIEDIIDNEILKNQVLFVNREKLNKQDNLFIKDNEQDRNLQNVVRNTKDDGKEIILIIDESHRTAKTDKSQELINLIWPKLTIEVSATPKAWSYDDIVKIRLSEVIAEGMIKREIYINPDIEHIKTNKDLIDLARRKREYLQKLFLKEGSNINPLMLIQIPDKKAWSSINPEDEIIKIVESLGITRANGKLAIKLSDKDKTTNREDIEKYDSPVEVLIFKQAIALWRDCPRAHILVLQREWKDENYTFNIQTLWRIMRMPEHKHYDDSEDLNIWYIYTASDNFTIVQELADNYATSSIMKRDNTKYQNIELPSEGIRRKREITRLSWQFKDLFLEECKKSEPNQINLNEISYNINIGGDGSITDIDQDKQKVKFKWKWSISKSKEQICQEYTEFLSFLTHPYAKSDSTNTLKTSIRYFFKNYCNIDDDDLIANIVLNPVNKDRFLERIEKTKDEYKNLPTKADEIISNENWQVAGEIGVFDNFKKFEPSEKSVMQPFFVKTSAGEDKERLSEPEKKFIENVLEESDDYLVWRYKNWERDSKFFGMAYKQDPEADDLDWFFPDFIIKTKWEIIIAEIKDDKWYRDNTNYFKMQRWKRYVAEYKGKDKVFFFMLSPKEYSRFLKHINDMKIKEYQSLFEKRIEEYQDGLKLEEKVKDFEEKSSYKKMFNGLRDILEPNTRAYLMTAEQNRIANEKTTNYNFNWDELIKCLELELRNKVFDDIRNDDVAYDIIEQENKAQKPNKIVQDYFSLKRDDLTLWMMRFLLLHNRLVNKYIRDHYPNWDKSLSDLVEKIWFLKDEFRNESAHGDRIISLTDYMTIEEEILWSWKGILIRLLKTLKNN